MDFMLSYDLQDIKTFSATVIVIFFPFSNCDNTISQQERKEHCLTLIDELKKKKTEFQYVETCRLLFFEFGVQSKHYP